MDRYRMIEAKEFNNFIAGFSAFIKTALLYLFIILRQYFILFAILFLSITAIGSWYYYSRPATYNTEMVCNVNNINHKTSGEMIQKLSILVNTQSYNALSYALGLPVEKVKAIVSLNGKNHVGSMLFEDYSDDRSPIYIQVTSTDRSIYPQLQAAILNYLNTSSPYKNARKPIEASMSKQKAVYLKQDLYNVDSIIAAYCSYLKNTTIIKDSISGLPGITGLITFKDRLEDRISWEENYRPNEIQHPYEVLHGFIPPDNPERPSKAVFIKLAAIAFIVSLSCCVLVRIFFK